MRFRLGTLLMMVAFVCVAVALSWQIILLRQQVGRLERQVMELGSQPLQAVQQAGYHQQVTPIGVPYSVEEAMLLEQQRIPLPRR